jgi:hypothetical protein
MLGVLKMVSFIFFKIVVGVGCTTRGAVWAERETSIGWGENQFLTALFGDSGALSKALP